MKKTLKIIGIVLLAVLVLAGGYVAYVFAAYHRIEDNQPLAVVSGQTQTARAGETYRIACWNIGFGAYEDDYSFFMDGGTESWAWSEERLLQNLDEIGAVIESLDSDITLLQEVDFDSTRTYHVNEADLLRNYHGLEADTDSVFAVNYDSPFLFYPFVRPHGASRSGLLTVSSLTVESALRRSLPVETGQAPRPRPLLQRHAHSGRQRKNALPVRPAPVRLYLRRKDRRRAAGDAACGYAAGI